MVQPNVSWRVLRLANLSYIHFGLYSVLSQINATKYLISEHNNYKISHALWLYLASRRMARTSYCKLRFVGRVLRKLTLCMRCEEMVEQPGCSIQQVPTQLQWLIVDKIKMLQKCENFSKTATWLSCGYHISMVELWSVRNINNQTKLRLWQPRYHLTIFMWSQCHESCVYMSVHRILYVGTSSF